MMVIEQKCEKNVLKAAKDNVPFPRKKRECDKRKATSQILIITTFLITTLNNKIEKKNQLINTLENELKDKKKIIREDQQTIKELVLCKNGLEKNVEKIIKELESTKKKSIL